MRNNQGARGATTEILLMEIAEGLATLIKQPDLSKKIKEAYALNDAERKALEDASEVLASAESVRKEMDAKALKYSDIEEKIQKQLSVKDSNSALLATIKEERKKNDEKAAQIKEDLGSLDAISKAFGEKEVTLATWEASLKEREQQVLQQQAGIKEALNKSKMIFSGLE